ncbi:MAG: peptidylprolyl isomerase [Bacillota bacterium]|nr:peptidylprolyl isomerase [Bacillota bacterium]
MKKVFVIALALAMIFTMAACGSTLETPEAENPAVYGDVLATVNGNPIYEAEYANYLGSYYQSAYGNYSTYQQYYGVDLLKEEGSEEMFGSMEYYAWNVLVQASIIREMAEEYNITFEETFLEEWLDWGYFMGIKTSILYNDLVDVFIAEMEAEMNISENDIYGTYDEDPVKWDGRKTSHILLMCDTEDEAAKNAAYEEAVALIARLNDGEDFATLAKENSDDGSASEGGVINAYINEYGNEVGSENAFYEEYVAGAYTLDAVGDFTQEPVLSSAGYHIIKIDDIREGAEANMEVIRKSLSAVSEEDAIARLGDEITTRTGEADIEMKSDVYRYYEEEMFEDEEGEADAEGEADTDTEGDDDAEGEADTAPVGEATDVDK